MVTFSDNKASENIKKYICNICDFSCCKKGDWNRHILRQKHINLTLSNGVCDKKNIYTCYICDKIYNSRNGLWNHKKKCKENEKNIISENNDIPQTTEIQELKEFMKYLMKENSDLKNMMFDVIKNGTHNTINNTTHTNSHNKAFNLNFFLNETCKNAMNITDFVDSIKLQLSDLIDVGTLGYVEGISKIIVKNLNDLDETKRPIHCVDKKRETMYVKDKGQWEKDDEKKTKLTKAVKRVADKNINLLPQFREKYPDYNNSSSKTSDKYEKMVIEVMSTDEGKNDKIIKKISNVTIINKE
jgi:hypothetical protein